MKKMKEFLKEIEMSNKRVKGIIFTRGDYPIGSSALRIRLWNKGFIANQIDSKIVITFPSPSEEDLLNSEKFVYFALKPVKRKTRNVISIFLKIIGILKGYIYLKKNRDLDFVFLYGIGFLEGYFVKRFCKISKVKFFAERCDENRQQFCKKKLSIVDFLALYNDKLFDKYILNKTNTFLVVSEYLEKKYRQIYPNHNIKRSVPSFIDYEQFQKYQKNDIFSITGRDLSIFKSNKLKIVFAGSCIFTNGLEFFLECASVSHKRNLDFQIVLIFSKGDVNLIKNLILKLKIENVVTIIEDIYYPYIPAIYKHSDILVLPEMGDVVANAGFPGKTAEYLASGKAIITTDFSNLKDYLKHGYNCMMSSIGDLDKYTENLNRLILEKSLREHLGQNAILTAIKYFDYKKGVLPLVEEL